MVPAIRHFSQQSIKPSRSRQAIAVYSYMVVGFLLPFACPLASRLQQRQTPSSELSLHHCSR
ncbi:hypothetical protein FPQ18DRAFT_326166 [Pyronema domesticum]|nr:hypothetical protein FPQ18DRAFT_326166 [Pyronema domesticum]